MRLGIIGGMGPMASVYFTELITMMTDARKDQDHIETFVLSRPSIPDRTAFALGRSDEDPVPMILESLQMLDNLGADVVAIPCVTAHCFQKRLEGQSRARILDAVDITCGELSRLGVTKTGILATEGTIRCEIFDKALIARGIEPIVPDDATEKLIMSVIYDDIKQGLAPSKEKTDSIVSFFREAGAQKLILGCTELSLLRKSGIKLEDTVDVLEVLAKESIKACGYKVREDYL